MNASRPKQLRVVMHLIPTLSPGGGEIQLLRNIEHFDRERFDHLVVYVRPPSTLLSAFQDVGAKVHCLDPENRKPFIARVLKLRRLIRDSRVSVIHSTNAEADKLGGVAGLLTRVPVVATLNTNAYTQEWLVDNPTLNVWKLRYMKLTRKVVLRLLVRRFNAVSASVKESFEESLGLKSQTIDVIYRGVDPDKFRRRQHATFGPRPDAPFPRLVTVGRLVSEKGHKYLIDAMPMIRQAYPSATLQIVGDGYLADSLRERAQILLQDDAVTFLGYRADIPKILRDADIFVLPSIVEGCPNALLEAMAVGLPCIAADIGPVREIVSDGLNGVLTKPIDSDAIVGAVTSVASDRNRMIDLGEAATSHVTTTFTIDRAARDLEDLYSSV